MQSSSSQELHTDVQPSLWIFFYTFYSTTTIIIIIILLLFWNPQPASAMKIRESIQQARKFGWKTAASKRTMGNENSENSLAWGKLERWAVQKIQPAEAAKSKIFGHPGNVLQSEGNCSAMCSELEPSTQAGCSTPSLHLSFAPVPFPFTFLLHSLLFTPSPQASFLPFLFFPVLQ